LAWPKKETKIENKESVNSKLKVKQLQTELSSLKSKLNNLPDHTQKSQLENKLSNLESQINNSPSQSVIKKLEQEIKEVKKKLEEDNDDKPNKDKNDEPNDKSPNPEPIPPQIPKPNNNKEKKILANLIKADLQEKLKNPNDENLKASYHNLLGSKDTIFVNTDNEEVKSKIKKTVRAGEDREISSNDLEPEDWKEIINLVRQLEKLRKEKDEQKKQEREDKLNNNPKLFYYYNVRIKCRCFLIQFYSLFYQNN